MMEKKIGKISAKINKEKIKEKEKGKEKEKEKEKEIYHWNHLFFKSKKNCNFFYDDIIKDLEQNIIM